MSLDATPLEELVARIDLWCSKAAGRAIYEPVLAELARRARRSEQHGYLVSPRRRTHGRGCPCTPCQAEDWDAIDRGLCR